MQIPATPGSEPKLTRWQFVRYQLFGSRWVKTVTAVVGLPTSLLASLQVWRSELESDAQEKYGLVSWVPVWPWWVYALIVLGLIVVLLFETAYRLYRSILTGRNTRSVLLNLWNDGHEIRKGCIERTLPNPEEALRNWNQRVFETVVKLDPSYVMELQNQSGMVAHALALPSQLDGYPESDTYVQCFTWTAWRMDKLKELASELRKSETVSLT